MNQPRRMRQMTTHTVASALPSSPLFTWPWKGKNGKGTLAFVPSINCNTTAATYVRTVLGLVREPQFELFTTWSILKCA